MTATLAITVDLAEWLVLTGKGQAKNFSVPINGSGVAGGVTQKQLNPPQGVDLMLIYGIQFDGVLSGQITFQIVGTNGSMIAGYAVQSFIQDEILINDRGMPFQFLANSQQAQSAVLNIDYVGIPGPVWERDVLPFLSQHIPGGR